MIILWNARGRLGNQLFQLSYMESDEFKKITNYLPKKIFFIGVEYVDLLSKFSFGSVISYFFCKFYGAQYFLRWLMRALTSFLAKFRVIGSLIQEEKLYGKHLGISKKVRYRKGLLNSILYLDGYFQFAELSGISTRYKHAYYQEQKNLYFNQGIINKAVNTCAIHFRLTDYLNWEQIGYGNLVLPINYYVKSIQKVMMRHKETFFYVYSDDIAAAKIYMDEISSKLEFGYEFAPNCVDHMLSMGFCRDKILSASTYAWWAWRLSFNDAGMVYVPNYWLGYKAGFEYPPGIIDDRMNAVDVL